MHKICIVISTFNAGGIENYVLRYLKFTDTIENYTILARTNISGDLYDDYLATGVEIVTLPLGYLNPKNFISYIRFFKKQKFHVVCDFNANFAGSTLFLAKMAGIEKRIAFYRQGSNHFKPSLIKNVANDLHNRLVFNYATHILANSKAALDFFFPNRKEADNRFQVVYNGIEVNQYTVPETKNELREVYGVPKDKYVVGHVGRNDYLKNHETIFKVFKQLLEIDKTFFLVLCGSGTEELTDSVEKLNISNNVLILGYRNDVPKVLKTFDCFYFPSLSEGQPNALIEAMLSNLPILCSNIKPILECIPEEAKPFTFAPLDYKKQMQLIINIRQERNIVNYKEFARKKYDANNQFNRFKSILNE